MCALPDWLPLASFAKYNIYWLTSLSCLRNAMSKFDVVNFSFPNAEYSLQKIKHSSLLNYAVYHDAIFVLNLRVFANSFQTRNVASVLIFGPNLCFLNSESTQHICYDFVYQNWTMSYMSNGTSLGRTIILQTVKTEETKVWDGWEFIQNTLRHAIPWYHLYRRHCTCSQTFISFQAF